MMRLLEHESKEILQKYKIPVPKGRIVRSADEVVGDWPVVVKTQVPTGGRAKLGGIIPAKAEREAKEAASKLFSCEFDGYRATRILLEEQVEVAQEFYLSITYDTLAKAPIAIFSQEGGVDIEELAESEPGKIIREHFRIQSGLPTFKAREIVSRSNLCGKLLVGLGQILSSLAKLFVELDGTVAEINPLALTKDERLVALDCHLEVDDDALFRHPKLSRLCQDEGRFAGGRQSSWFERRAAEIDNMDHRGVAGRVIEFDGNLGLIIGGGGASLTAFDAVRTHGGRPANYCEFGGNPSVRKVTELTKLILTKPNVTKIAVISNVVSNTRADLVARGVIKGVLEAGRSPADTVVIFRVPGAWEDEAFKILAKYRVSHADRRVSIDEAAMRAVQAMGI